MTEYYAIRYLPNVEVKYRKQSEITGRYETYEDAEVAREKKKASHLMHTVLRDNEVKVGQLL